MPRVNLPVTEVTRVGIVPPAEVAGDAGNGHHFTNDGRTILVARNSGATTRNVTIQTPGTVDGLAIADRSISVAAGVTKYIGPFPTNVYNQIGVLADLDRVYVDVDHAELVLSTLRVTP